MNELLDCRWRGRHDRKTIAPFGFELRLDKSQYPVFWRVRYKRHSQNRSILTRDADRSVFTRPIFPLHCDQHARSEEHTSELQSLMRISYAVFCLKKKKKQNNKKTKYTTTYTN